MYAWFILRMDCYSHFYINEGPRFSDIIAPRFNLDFPVEPFVADPTAKGCALAGQHYVGILGAL